MSSTRVSHDQYFLQLLKLVAARSTCVRRAVGAILVSEDNQILSTGYNGVPRGRYHCVAFPCQGAQDQAGDTSRCEAVHAEVNAILQCHRLDLAHTLYVSCTPCFVCAKMICNTNIHRIVVLEEYADKYGRSLLNDQGILVDVYVLPDSIRGAPLYDKDTGEPL